MQRPVKALILAYDFPPLVRVGGLRAYSWLRYLGAYGVEPVVVTRQWENRYGDERDYVAPSATPEVVVEPSDHGTVLRTPYRPNLSNRLLLTHGPKKFRLIRKAITAAYEIGQYYLPIGPRYGLYQAAREYLHRNPVDALVATGEPFVLFRYASLLASEFGIPWIADYRDPWSHDLGQPLKQISPSWETRVERRFTRSVSAVTTVSEFFRDLLAPMHPGKTVHIVPNGYDPEAVAMASGVEQGHDRLTIALAGSLYPWHPVRSFLEVCDRLVRERGCALSLKFVGINARTEVEGMLASEFPGLAPHVTILDRLPNGQAAAEMSAANALLLFNDYATVGSKVYEYLALRRKVLLCFSNDPEALRLKERCYNLPHGAFETHRPIERLIEEARAGVVIRDAHHLDAVLRGLLDEFQKNRRIAWDGASAEAFSRRAQAQRMAAILREMRQSCARS